MIKATVLYLVLCCNKGAMEKVGGKEISKICMASAIGTMVEIVGLLIVSSYSLFIICVHVFEIPFMVWFVMSRKRQHILRLIITGYFFTMLINGILEALWNQFGESGSYIFYLLFACGAVIVATRVYRNYTRLQKGIFQVELVLASKKLAIKGFYDSGNRLIDPYTGKGVHIVSRRVLEELNRNVQGITPVYVPYQALGNESGMLEVYYIDELVVEGEKGRRVLINCPMGVTKDNLFEGKAYEIILNEEVF